MFNENPELIITSLDKQIWDEELENFVPKNIFDVHTHISVSYTHLTLPTKA